MGTRALVKTQEQVLVTFVLRVKLGLGLIDLIGGTSLAIETREGVGALPLILKPCNVSACHAKLLVGSVRKGAVAPNEPGRYATPCCPA
jgi:hypothetical protein